MNAFDVPDLAAGAPLIPERKQIMPLPLFAALAALTLKEIGVIATTAAVSTVAASITHDSYQKIKDAANSSDRDSKDRGEQ